MLNKKSSENLGEFNGGHFVKGKQGEEDIYQSMPNFNIR